jgi:hypothetical protein
VIVAYYFPHNEGVEYGILTEPGQDTGTALVDLDEVDGAIRTFAERVDAEAWLRSRSPHVPIDDDISVRVHFEYPPKPMRPH